MSEEGEAFLAELREFRGENDRLMSETRTEIAALRNRFDERFREMHRRLDETGIILCAMTTRLQEIMESNGEIIQRLGRDPGLPGRRTLG